MSTPCKMSSKTDIQGIPMPISDKNIPLPKSESIINPNKAVNHTNVEHDTEVKFSSPNVADVTKVLQTEISTEPNSNLKQDISKTHSLAISSSLPAVVPKTSVLGIENAKKRLRAFAIQKKSLPFLPLKAGLKGLSCSTNGKNKTTNPLEAANKKKKPPKNRSTRKLLPIPQKLIPDTSSLTERQLSYIKPELRDVKPELSYVKTDLNYLKPELNYPKPNLINARPDLNYLRPDFNYLKPELPEVRHSLVPEDVDKKLLLVELGVPLGLIDTITTEKKMPTKAMPPIQGLIDHMKVEEFLKEAREAHKAGKTLKFQYERQTFHNKIVNPTSVERNRSTRSREEDYDRRSDRHRSRRHERSERDTSSRVRSKETDRRSKGRDSKSKNDKPTVKKRESESDSKDAADVNLEDYLVCDSWSLDTEVKEEAGKSPKIPEPSKKETKVEPEKREKDTVTKRIEKLKAFTEMFSYGIIDTDQSDQDEAEYSAVPPTYSKAKTPENQLASETTPEKKEISSKCSSSLERDIETQSVRSQTSELKDTSLHEAYESQTPEYEYPESEFSHISVEKGKDMAGRDLTDTKEEKKVELDGKDYWTLVMKMCQPIMFKHDGDNCKKETRTQPSIVYKESPKHCLCVNDREAVYKEIGSRQAILVQSISKHNSYFNNEERSSREWYSDVAKCLTCSTIDYATNWETDSSQNSETRHESRQNLKCPSPNTPQYEPDGSRTFLAQEYEKFMESVWPEIAEDERQIACFDNSSQDLSVNDGHSKIVDKIGDSLHEESKGKSKESDLEHVTPPKSKKTNKIKDKKEQSKTRMSRRKKRISSSSASRSSSSDTSSSNSSSQSEEDNTRKKKNTKRTIKTKKAKLKAVKKKKAEKAKLRLKMLKEKQLKKKKEKAKKRKEKEDDEKFETELVKSRTKAIKEREKNKDRKRKEKKKKQDVSSSSSDSESDKEVRKAKKKKKVMKRKRIPSLSSPEKTKKRSKKEKKVKQKKKNENDPNSVSESESDHFDVNVLNNIKAERVSDEEMKDITEPVIPRPIENLDFSPRRRCNQNSTLPAEIISVSELHSEFENLRYKDVKIKQEVENEICIPKTTDSQTSNSDETNIEQKRVEEDNDEVAETKLDLNVAIKPVIDKPNTDMEVDVEKDIDPKIISEEAEVFKPMEVEATNDAQASSTGVSEIGYEFYVGDYDENGCFYGYESNSSAITYETQRPSQLMSQGPPGPQNPQWHDDHKQMELHQIETVVSNLTCRGEIKCDWRPGQDVVKSEVVEVKTSRWGMQSKPCESSVVHTADVDFSKSPPSTAQVYRIPSILDSNNDYSDSQKVYKIETISSSHLRDPSLLEYTEVPDFQEPMSQDYEEAYQDVYGAADQLQYGDCFAQSNERDEEEEEKKRRLSLDDRINMVLAAVQAKSLEKEVETKPESPIPDKGILINGRPDVIHSENQPIIKKRVTFADGYNPGQDSDTEDPPRVQKRRRNGAARRRGCAYPCLPGHPDYDPLWDILPPPPPPPGSPPPAVQPPVSVQVLRAGRHRSREEVSQLISPALPADKYIGVTRLPKGLGHPV